MANSKATKKALFMSMMSLLLCFTMLMGATFAWFTDTVTSSNNKIIAGSLQVGLEMFDGTKYVDIGETPTPIFGDENSLIAKNDNANTLWEPGKTQVAYLKIVNKGNLSLKYKVDVEVKDVSKDLYKAMRYAIVPDATNVNEVTSWNAADGKTVVEGINPTETTGLRLDPNGEHYFALVIHMQEEAGNEYQGGEVEFDIIVNATQVEAEFDSFGPTYDENADFRGQISGIDSLKAALAEGGNYEVKEDITVPDGEVIEIPEGKTLGLNLGGNALNNTLTNNGDVTVNGGEINATANNALYNEGSAELKDVTLNMTGSDGYITNSRTEDSVTIYENVTATSSGGGVNVWEGEAIFKSGTITTNCIKTNPRHMFYVANGAKLTIEDGEFFFNPDNLTRKGSYICAQGNATVIVNGGTFHKPSTRTAPIQALDGSTVTIYGGTFEFDPSGFVADGYVAIEHEGKWSVVKGVFVNTQTDLEAAINDGKESVYLAAGNYTMPEPDLRGKKLTISGTKNTVIDVSAVDANDQFVTGSTLEFDGVTLNFGTVNYMGFANTASLTYKNCKINGLQFLYGDNVTFENCEFDSTEAEHSVWTYGAKNVSFIDCDFTYGDRGINCYSDNNVAGGKQTVNFTNCAFTTTNTASAGAVEINSTYFSVGIEVNLTDCIAPAYGKLAYVSPWDSTNGAKTTINIK